MNKLRLSPEDLAEYNKEWNHLQCEYELYAAIRDYVNIERIIQAKFKLYNTYKAKELPPEPEPKPDPYRRDEMLMAYELNLTIEERIDRIEQHLKIGKYA